MSRCKGFLRVILLVSLGITLSVGGLGCGGGEGSVELEGAGATFPEPLYKGWFAEYMKKHPNVIINYLGLGSGGGVSLFTEGTVFFGASDAAMNDEEIKKVNDNVLMLPLTAGSVVAAYNLKDASGSEIKDLKLSREVLAGIFSGKITKWNDEKLKKANPDVNLPDKPISVVVRADSSGTTFVFTHHLASISDEFKNDIAGGNLGGKTVKWPTEGGFTAQKGNSGITAQLKQNDGSIGYIEYGYATENDLTMASLENKSGTMIKPTLESGEAALAGAELPADNRLFFADPEGKDSYPIVSYTWLLVKKNYGEADAKKVATLKDLVKFALSAEGQKMAPEKGYIPLPEKVTKKVLKDVEAIEP